MSVDEFVIENILENLENRSADEDGIIYMSTNEFQNLWLPVKQTFKKMPNFDVILRALKEKHNIIAQKDSFYWTFNFTQ